MYQFKNTLATSLGLVVLITLGALWTPLLGDAFNGPTRLDSPKSQLQNVNVVNVPTVNAQQSGPWIVGLSGTPTVGLDPSNNTVRVEATAPLPISDVDNPARQPFGFSQQVQWPVAGSSAGAQFTVPAGKRLVIEQVSIFAENCRSATQSLRVAATTTAGNASTYHFTGTISGSFGIFDQRVASSQMRLYADPGTSPDITIFRNDGCGGSADSAFINVSGYLVNIP